MSSPVAAAWFQLVYRTNLVYNQGWEDPARDQEALGLGPDDRVLAITSAGCNVLDYALRGAHVVAVDANPRQNHLLELKLAGIRALPFDDFFALFGEGGTPRARAIYAALRGLLSRQAQAFWDRAIRLFDPSAVPGGTFYYGGTSGFFVSVRTGTVTGSLEACQHPFTAFVLLDHMDWMARRPALLAEEWQRIFAAAAPGARIIFRSGAVEATFLPGSVRERLRFECERALELHRRDRVGTYGSFHIAHVLA